MEDPLNVLDYWSHLEDAVVRLIQIRETHDEYMASMEIDTKADIEKATRVTMMTVMAEAMCIARFRVLIESRPDALPSLKRREDPS